MIKKLIKNDKGLSLIEVLVSTTILGIVLTTFLSFFTNAYSYTKRNQDTTVGINVARNVLYYFEQQNYQTIKDFYFHAGNLDKEVQLATNNCYDSGDIYNPDAPSDSDKPVDSGVPIDSDKTEEMVFNPDVCKNFFLTNINNVDYTAIVTLSSEVTNVNGTVNSSLSDYLIGVEVEVTWENQSATVKGLIKK